MERSGWTRRGPVLRYEGVDDLAVYADEDCVTVVGAEGWRTAWRRAGPFKTIGEAQDYIEQAAQR